jgi:hypothetical protein
VPGNAAGDDLKGSPGRVDGHENAAVGMNHRGLHRYCLLASTLQVAYVETELQTGGVFREFEGPIEIGTLTRREGFTSWH